MRRLLFLLPLLLVLNAPSHAQKLGRSSLRGLDGVAVIIESLEPEAERDGLTTSMIQTDVELRLRKAGITVRPTGPDDGFAYLYVNVNLLRSAIGIYVYAISVEFKQEVQLVRVQKPPSLLTHTAVTWNAGSVGTTSPQTLRNLRDRVGDHVDQFVNDYLAVNPKR